jgi:WD40 repeat protein
MTGHEPRVLSQGASPGAVVTTVVFSPDGKTLASGGIDSPIRWWDAATGKALGKISGHEHTVAEVFTLGSHRGRESMAHTLPLVPWHSPGWTR